jgi:hypothetical protein
MLGVKSSPFSPLRRSSFVEPSKCIERKSVKTNNSSKWEIWIFSTIEVRSGQCEY